MESVPEDLVALMQNNDNIYIVYTDGGCSKNPGGRGGYAAVIIKDHIPIYITGYEDNTTNQRMELKAVIAGLKLIEHPSVIKVYSDSAYVVNCFKDKWYKSWEKNNWKNSKNEEVANKQLWMLLLKLVRFHKDVEFFKVKGHSTDIINNKCDQLAGDIVDFKKKLDSIINVNE